MNRLISITLFIVCLFFSKNVCAFIEEIDKIDFFSQEASNASNLPDTSVYSIKAWELRRVNPPAADSLARYALNTIKKNNKNYYLERGLANKVLGYLEYKKSKKDSALHYYQKSIEVLSSGEYYEEKASVFLLLGNLVMENGALEEAIEYYYQGIRETDFCDCKVLAAILHKMIAEIKIMQGDFNTAKRLLYSALKRQEKVDVPRRIAGTYYGLGSLYAQLEQVDSALVFYEKARMIFEEYNVLWKLSTLYGGLGNVYVQKDSLDKALGYYKKGLRINKKINSYQGIAHAEYQIGNVLSLQNKYKQAIIHVQSALDLSRENKIASLIPQALKLLSEIKEQLGESKAALFLYKEYITERDTILNNEKETQIKEVEEKYQNEKLQRNNEQQAASAEREALISNTIIITLFAVLIIVVQLARNSQRKRRMAVKMADQQKQIYKQEMLQIQQASELRALNASQDGQEKERKRIAEALHNSMGSLLSAIQMHFQTISETMNFREENNRTLFNKSLELLKEASKTNRGIAHEMMPPILMKFGLAASLDYLTDKIKSPSIKVTTAVYGLEERLPEQLELSLYRIIDELINNILRHAKATEVSVQLIEHEDMLNVIVEDNGLGFEYDPKNKSYGLGLNNIMTRINHFNGHFEIDSSPGNGTTIIMDIPRSTYAPTGAK